jgi:hypothetical protein
MLEKDVLMQLTIAVEELTNLKIVTGTVQKVEPKLGIG